jgi:hypothetical protein
MTIGQGLPPVPMCVKTFTNLISVILIAGARVNSSMRRPHRPPRWQTSPRLVPEIDGTHSWQEDHQAIMPMPRHMVSVAASDQRQMAVIGCQYPGVRQVLAKRLNGSKHFFKLTSAGPLASHDGARPRSGALSALTPVHCGIYHLECPRHRDP